MVFGIRKRRSTSAARPETLQADLQLCFVFLRNHQDADEITNDTFLKAFIKRETIKYPEKLIGWLYTTAERAAIDLLRARQRDVNRTPELVSLDTLDGAKATAVASILAEQQVQQTETYQYLLTGLQRLLSEKDLEIVEYLLDGKKPKQIAKEIGSTAEAVQKRWERILKWLRPVAHKLDELINDLPSHEKKVMIRYLDNQPLEYIGENLDVSSTDVELCVKRVIKHWETSVKQNA